MFLNSPLRYDPPLSCICGPALALSAASCSRGSPPSDGFRFSVTPAKLRRVPDLCYYFWPQLPSPPGLRRDLIFVPFSLSCCGLPSQRTRVLGIFPVCGLFLLLRCWESSRPRPARQQMITLFVLEANFFMPASCRIDLVLHSSEAPQNRIFISSQSSVRASAVSFLLDLPLCINERTA